MGMLMGHMRRKGVADLRFRAACPRSLTDLLISTFPILSACFEALLLFPRGTPVFSAFVCSVTSGVFSWRFLSYFDIFPRPFVHRPVTAVVVAVAVAHLRSRHDIGTDTATALSPARGLARGAQSCRSRMVGHKSIGPSNTSFQYPRKQSVRSAAGREEGPA